MYIYKMSYRAAAVDAGKRALENAAKSTKWSGGQKRERDRREEKEERETQHWRVSSVKNERFYCILAHCVCVCVLPSAVASFADGLVKVQHRPQGAAEGAREGGGGVVQSSGPKGTEWQRQAWGNLLHFHIQLQLQQLQRFCIIKGSRKFPSHAQLKILIDDWMEQQQQKQQKQPQQ